MGGQAVLWASGWQEKACPGFISDTLTCSMLILGRDIGWGV